MSTRGGALLACGLTLALAGCGGSGASRSATTAATAAPSTQVATQATPTPRYSAAKRRYLAHFQTSCSRVDRSTAVTTGRLSRLIVQLGRGDPSAVRRVSDYLAATADGFARRLRRTLALGAPPPPDAAYGARYLIDALAMVRAIRSLAAAVARLDAQGIQTATRSLRATTLDARASARRYGFATCASAPADTSVSAGGPIA
jgi:hypothetical protein